MANRICTRWFDKARIAFRNQAELMEIRPRAVMEAKCCERGVFRVDKVKIEECNILRVVEQSAAGRASFLTVRESQPSDRTGSTYAMPYLSSCRYRSSFAALLFRPLALKTWISMSPPSSAIDCSC